MPNYGRLSFCIYTSCIYTAIALSGWLRNSGNSAFGFRPLASVCLMSAWWSALSPTQIFTEGPFLCVEILSPEGRMSRVQEHIADYPAFGACYIWLIDPATSG